MTHRAKTARPIPVFFVSLGCAKNLVDTEVMAGTLAQAGFVLTNDAESARVRLINTCSFVADARTEAEEHIRDGLRWRRQRDDRRLVVAGCLPQRNLPEVRARFPGVDLFIGLDDVPRIAELLGHLLAGEATGREAQALNEFGEARYLYDENAPRLLLTPTPYAYVKIAEGCNHGCRFCAIPGIRGRQRSRPAASIVNECRQLLGMGVRELNLIAQDTTSYGRDLHDGSTLASLLRLLDALDGDFWLRVLYTHPRHLTEEILAVFATARRLVPYIDIPLQHISDHVLRDMGRGMGGQETRELMATIRRTVPGVTVRTTFLVGYPGETEADFNELLAYIREYRFDRLGAFAYSPEAGTPAVTAAAGLVSPRAAVARRRRIMEAQQQIALELNRSMIGKTIRVLADAPGKRGEVIGRTAGDAPDVDNLVRIRAPHSLLDRGFVDVNVTAAEPYKLHGTPSVSA